MSVTPTYPGVYIQEVSSGTHTIAGVSTSIAAFVGEAKTGPINEPVRARSFAQFERSFGGLDPNSEMSYAVYQFFLNGGTDAWIVRVAANASPAHAVLTNGGSQPKEVLTVTAREAGLAGNNIQIDISYPDDPNVFDLTVSSIPPHSQSATQREVFSNLSMNSQDARFVETVVGNNDSAMVDVKSMIEKTSTFPNGESISGELKPLPGQEALADYGLRVSVDGGEAVLVKFDSGSHDDIPTQIQRQVLATPPHSGFKCAYTNKHLSLKSGSTGENSSVRVMPPFSNDGVKDATALLLLGAKNGGREIDAAHFARPAAAPTSGTLIGGDLGQTVIDLAAETSGDQFILTLDGGKQEGITVDFTKVDPLKKNPSNSEKWLNQVAAAIEQAVRERPPKPAFQNFTCVAKDNTLILTSGTTGTSSSVNVEAGTSNDIAALLKLTGEGVTTTSGTGSKRLAHGTADPITSTNAAQAYILGEDQQEGIYALATVDFDLLCLPGVTNDTILDNALSYCKTRRAFLIADLPSGATPESALTAAKNLRNSSAARDHGAVYFPWIEIGDPLTGRTRASAPSGTMAGVYARTDGSRGVWKAPAGLEAVLSGAQGLAYKLTDAQNGTLNPQGVNCLRSFSAGRVCWGARTLAGFNDSPDQDYEYVPVRRLALYIESSLYEGTQWAVFEPNDESLWSSLRLSIGSFMHELFRKGAFPGKTPKECYFVKCDSDTTTEDDVNLGRVNVMIGFAPLKPAEFVVLTIEQMAGQ